MRTSPVASRADRAVQPQSFEALYRTCADPWGFATSAYELNRYELVLQALRRPTYEFAFEPGCSVGVLTARLAARCNHVLATEVSQTALRHARARCRHAANVDFQVADLREWQPVVAFDLIVFSEIGYYFAQRRLIQLAARLAAALRPNGELIACHWLGYSEDHILHGAQVHATLRSSLAPDCTHSYTAWHPGFRVEGWVRR